MRWGESSRFIDKNAVWPAGRRRPPEWPVPQLRPADEIARWRQANGLGTIPPSRWAPARSAPLTYYRCRAAVCRARLRCGGRRPGERAKQRSCNRRPAGARPAPICATELVIAARSRRQRRADAHRRRDRHADQGIFGPTDPFLWAPHPRRDGAANQSDDRQPCQRTVCTMNTTAACATSRLRRSWRCGACWLRSRAIDPGDLAGFRIEAELIHNSLARPRPHHAPTPDRASRAERGRQRIGTPGGVSTPVTPSSTTEFSGTGARRHQRRAGRHRSIKVSQAFC